MSGIIPTSPRSRLLSESERKPISEPIWNRPPSFPPGALHGGGFPPFFPPGPFPPDPRMLTLALSSLVHYHQSLQNFQQLQVQLRLRMPSLNSEAQALIGCIQQRAQGGGGTYQQSIRKGPVSLDELMGNNGSAMSVPFSGGQTRNQYGYDNYSKGMDRAMEGIRPRRLFYQPYLNTEGVKRGIENGSLVTGELRVNQRNYEEAFLDDPSGGQDILVLGLHDRNRTLNRDIVVVRIKDRQHWIVRENVYLSWRSGELNVSRDDDGRPISIPPIPTKNEKEEIIEKSTGQGSGKKAAKGKKKQHYQYDKSELLSLCTTDSLPDSISTLISSLSISRRKTEMSEKSAKELHRPGRRPSHRFLCTMPADDWGMPDLCLQKTAEVVYLLERRNSRAAVGQFKVMADANTNWGLFSPNDSRMPRMMVPAKEIPRDLFENPGEFVKLIYLVRLTEWEPTAQFARGKLERHLGKAGEIKAETEGLLISNAIDSREFLKECLPPFVKTQWLIPETEASYRRDFRSSIVFTIDPATARDLDDAIHIRRLADDSWEIGVHIADVSYFAQEGGTLDQWAKQRATSVYLVHQVVPMLPEDLSEGLCSLRSGVDRLTFSVVWKMNDDAEIQQVWFGRSIINSCAQLSYEQAQAILDYPAGSPPSSVSLDLFQDVSLSELSHSLHDLHSLTKKMGRRRFKNGALRLDAPKLIFSLDSKTKMPIACKSFERLESHCVVEELMLQTNISVATRIEEKFPQFALLRRHPEPNAKLMREVLQLLSHLGLSISGSDSSMLERSIEDQSKNPVKSAILTQLLMRPMKLGVYFCAGSIEDRKDYKHYALNVPLYTHFTSPIRRYPDILVHRLLAASLGYCPVPNWSVNDLEMMADHCNEKKWTAKQASDASTEFFFALFVKEAGELAEVGVVLNVLDQSFDVLLVRFGIIKRVYVNKLAHLSRDARFAPGPPPSLHLFWSQSSGNGNAAHEQIIKIATKVNCVVSPAQEPNKLQVVIKPSHCSESAANDE